MPVEIERKFLVSGNGWRAQSSVARYIRQGYLANLEGLNSIRVRIDGDKANINIKSGRTTIRRLEFEYDIPVNEAQQIMDNLVSGRVIEKTRHIVPYGDHQWEVDEFHGDNEGLVVAEIELSAEDESFKVPEWAGEEVSGDPRYYNINLVSHPYKNW